MEKITSTVVLAFFGCCFSALGYTDLGNQVYQSDGSPGDTQAAINAAPDGYTVQIPNGSYSWSSGVTITDQGIHLKGQSVGGVTITQNGSDIALTVDENTRRNVEVSGLRFVQGSGSGMFLEANPNFITTSTGVGDNGKGILLHDCYFETNGNGARRSIQWQINGGVIWNCQFYSNQQDDNAIAFKAENLTSSWFTPSTMGTADTNGTANTYLEDCTFKDIYTQALDFDGNSRVVVRHCTFDNSAITSHGQDTGPNGTRHWEIYDNTFIFTTSGGNYPLPLVWWYFARGGTGIIADNVMPNIVSQMWGDKAEILFTVYNIRRTSQYIPCQTSYPAARQIGQSYTGSNNYTDPVYIWGNSGGGDYDNPGREDYNPDECGNGQTVFGSTNPYSPVYLQQGRDYITGTAKPGYSKYTYPHPLRASTGSPSPTPTPTPTPTPSPSPTPTPTPAPSGGSAVTLFGSATPGTVTENDPNPVELGVKFQSSQAGTVTGLRFYKGPRNTSRHTGHLWSASGQLLATVTFSNETASGWQQASFASPVAIAANATYVASYHCNGFYSEDDNYFSQARVSGPLTAPPSGGSSGGNGVYAYGSGSAFPTQTYLASNYWIDVLFSSQ